MFVEEKEQGEVQQAPAKLDEASQLLLKAAALIEKRGHCQGVERDSQDRLCFLGALKESHGGSSDDYNSGPVYTAAMRMSRAIGGGVFWKWNDAHTKDEVVAKMRAVALGG